MEMLESGEHGISQKEAEKRLKENGANELPETKRQSYAAIFFKQFKSSLIYILLISGLVVLFMGELTDAAVIFFVLLFNAVVGTVQEGKAQNTFLALKKFIKGRASVLRDKKETAVSDREIVAGDIIILREGEKVPADARLIYSSSLKIDEAAITGESLPKLKTAKKIKSDLPVMNQENMVFKGTVAVSGYGKAAVTATGIETFLGGIAKETLNIDAEFPLKSSIRKLSRVVIYFVSAVALAFSFLGWQWGYSFLEIFKTIVAISVSVIPEGLPIVITLVLAAGVWRMGKKNVLVKKLQAVEVLGETEILAVDKTGTVTKNELVAEKVYTNGKIFEITGLGYSPEGEVKNEGKIIDPPNHPELLIVGKIAALNSNASLILKKRPKDWLVSGDPTEGAMTVFSNKIGFMRDDLIEEMPLISELPFDYELKYHASLHRAEKGNFLAVSGSPEVILNLCQRERSGESAGEITEDQKKRLLEVFLNMSREGLRVIALAYAETSREYVNPKEMPPLIFAGFLGIKDALRKEVAQAVEKVESSGIRVVMITGDHKVTAEAIAKEAGIYKAGEEILSGEDIEKMDEKGLSEKIRNVSVFARVTPDHKLKIIRAYKLNGIIIAMTGDGVNDALSLTAADIGIGMGKIGTDVAKEASDIVLLDDNFASIVQGVEEGRSIFKTIKKVVLYLFSTSLGEVLAILTALFIGFPLPILAAQILWLNLVTDGFLDVALAMEVEKSEDKTEKTFKKKIYLLDKLMGIRMFLMAVPMAIGTLYLFSQNYQEDISKAWTISLVTLAVFQWFNAWNCRSEEKSIFSLNPFSNKFLVLATIIVVSLQFLAVYNPFFQNILKTVPIGAKDWLIILPIAFSIVVVEEIRKFFYRREGN